MKIIFIIAPFILCSCFTTFSQDAQGLITYRTTSDGGGFRKVSPDGSITEVWGGNNSRGQQEARKALLGAITRVELGKTVRAISADDVSKIESGAEVTRSTNLRELSNEVEIRQIDANQAIATEVINAP